MKTVVLFLGALASVYGASPGYEFTILVKPGDTIAGKTLTGIGSSLIDNAGTVVFFGSFAGGSGIFTPTDLLVQTGNTISGKTLTSIGEFHFNDAGMLAFSGSFAGGSGIFTPSQVLVQTGDVISGRTITGFGRLSSPGIGGDHGFAINNTGTLVFEATCEPPNTLSGGSQYPCQGIFTTSQSIGFIGPFGGSLYSPFINDIGNLGYEVYGPDNLLLQLVTNYGVGVSADYISSPVINNSGSLVYWSASAVTATTSIGSTSGTLASGNIPYMNQSSVISGYFLCDVFVDPAMNNPGMVLFGAKFGGPHPPQECGSSGLLTPSELLVQIGDQIASKTVQSLSLSGHLNDAGTVVFSAGFTDGTGGIVLATPISSGVDGDVNGDGIVDCTDLAIVKAAFERRFGQAGFNPRADVNGDGVIDIHDLAFVAQKISSDLSCQ